MMSDLKNKSEDYWKEKLTPEQYKILREKGTEAPFTGSLLQNKDSGTYVCVACDTPLFSSDTKFESGSGWPSFSDVLDRANPREARSPNSHKSEFRGSVELIKDRSLGMVRTEIVCKACGGHLGHVFSDGPCPTGERYCVNSTALQFKQNAQ